jgi:serine/threonine-protein kinase RsbW
MSSTERPDTAGRPWPALHAVDSSSPELLRRVPAEADQVAGVRDAVRNFVRACGAAKAAEDDIALAVGEACTNVVMHAYVDAVGAGWLVVEASHLDGELVVAVRDEGGGMLPRTDSPGLGLGLSIIGQLSQRLEIIEHGASGTEVRMTFVVAAEN